MTTTCTECNGSGEYVGFTSRQRCETCRGTGKLNGATDALKSVFDFNDIRHKGEPISCDMPQIVVGTMIHIYDADWYEAEVFEIQQRQIFAATLCDTFTIPANDPTFNLTQNQWEYIKAGTPVWP